MPSTPRPLPAALPHGELRAILPDLYLVTGTLALPGLVPMRFSRNMTVVREGERLIVINSVRLDDAGLAELDKLGKVTDVVRLAGNHGMDDPFYKQRYGAKVWVVRGQRYTRGFNTDSPDTYFTPDVEMDAGGPLPLSGARLYVLDSKPSEALLVLQRDGGVVVAGDCLQHWHTPDRYFNLLGKFMARRFGFIKPHNVGPAWVKQGKPSRSRMLGILDLNFAVVLPAHGEPVLADATRLYRPAIEAAVPG